MKQLKYLSLYVALLALLLLLPAGCRPSSKEPKVQVAAESAEPKLAEQAPQPAIEPTPEVEVEPTPEPAPAPEVKAESTSEPPPSSVVRPPSSDDSQPVELALKFAPQDSTTYRVVTEASRAIEGQGALLDDNAFKGGATTNKTEMTFTQQIKTVDPQGNAIAEITIRELKCLAVVKDNTVLDFDSSREADQNNPLNSLIGQTYTIELTPTGEVSKIIDTAQARAVIKGSSSASRMVQQMLSDEAIEHRHGVPTLAAVEENPRRPGDTWNSIKSYSFGMMGSKSYERIYTLKEVSDTDGRKIAVIEMKAIPSAESEEDIDDAQAMGMFSKMFDNTETYTGRLELDLTAGKLERYSENLRSQWLAVDPAAGRNEETDPAALKMTAVRSHHVEKLD